MATRLMQLDVLRAAAVLLVIASHMPPPSPDVHHAVAALGQFLRAYGGLGVDLFFVLSGFLVSGLLFRERQTRGSVRVGRFLLRRGLKIYPAFYVFMVVTVVLRIRLGQVFTPRELVTEGLFVQNYGQGVWTHTWSLAVEEHFYLMLAAMIVLLMRVRPQNPFRSLPWIFLLASSVVILARVLTYVFVVPFTNRTHWFPTHLRLDSLLFGVLLSHYYHSSRSFPERVRRQRWAVVIGSSALLIGSQSLPGELLRYAIGPVFVYLGFGGILVASVCTTPPSAGAWRATLAMLAALGSFSYSIYLWHAAVFAFGLVLIERFLGRPPGYYEFFAIYATASVLFGIVASKCVEMPVLHLRDAWLPSGHAAPAAAVSASPAPMTQDRSHRYKGTVRP